MTDLRSPAPIDPFALLEHASWARSLAAHLVRDDASADDLVQETWLAAIRRPPSDDRPLRPWLATVMRRLALKRRRDDGRRERRDRDAGEGAARGEAPAAGAVAAAMEAQRLLADAVASLPEPFRTTVFLRYYHGLDGNEVAERTRVAPGTARWRLARGLELLRERLAEDELLGRDGWRAALLPLLAPSLAGPAAPPAGDHAALRPRATNRFLHTTAAGGVLAAGATAMGLGTKLAIGAAAALLVAVGAWFGADSVGGGNAGLPSKPGTVALAPEPVQTRPSRRARAAGAEPAAAGDASTSGETPSQTEAAGSESAASAATAPVRSGPRARGRVVDAHGAGVPETSIRVLSEGEPLETTTGEDGRFELSFPPLDGPRGIRLTACADGFAAASRRADVAPSGTTELGEIVLGEGGSVEGVVVGGDGAPVVNADVGVLDPDLHGRDIDSVRRNPVGATLDAPQVRTGVDGRFVLPGVPAGTPRLFATSRGRLGAATGPLEVRPRRRSSGVRLALERPDPSEVVSGVVLDAGDRPVAGARIHYSYDTGRVSGTSEMPADADGRFTIILGKGSVRTLTASDPAGVLASATVASIRTGDPPVTLRLGASRSVKLRVRGPDGAPVQRFGWAAATADGSVVASESTAAHEGGEASVPLPSVRVRLVVDADGFDVGQSEVLDPAAPPTQTDVVLAPLPGLRGRVEDAAGPVTGALVELVAAIPESEVVEVNHCPALCDPMPAATSRSAADGAFAVTARTDGRWYLRVTAEGHAPTLAGPWDVAARTGRADLVVKLAAPGTIEGQVLVDPGRDPAGIVLSMTNFDGLPRGLRTGPEGRFRAEGLAPGAWQVAATENEIHAGEMMMTRGSGKPVFEPNVTVPEGAAARLTLDLRASRGVVLRIDLRIDGRPAAGRRVALVLEESVLSREEVGGRTDDDGRAALTTTRPRRGGVRVAGASGPSFFVAADLTASRDLPLRFETGTVEISGLPSDGGRNYLLVVAGADGATGLSDLEVDPAGRAVVTGLLAGRVRLVAANDMSREKAPTEWPGVADGELRAGATLTLAVK